MHIEPDRPAQHDDVADALAAATLPVNPRSAGRVVCGLAVFAAPEKALAEATVPDLNEEVVETGGGLKLYRRPPFQSVTGDEVALPPGSPEQSGGLRYWHPARGVIPIPNPQVQGGQVR